MMATRLRTFCVYRHADIVSIREWAISPIVGGFDASTETRLEQKGRYEVLQAKELILHRTYEMARCIVAPSVVRLALRKS
eukprot:scaffold649312_cov45-Prasinocladus_malaysianus.AAC.1